MMSDPDFYKKQNSFAQLERRATLGNVLPRIQQLDTTLERIPAPTAREKVMRQACRDILRGSVPPGASSFQLHPNVIEEMGRLSDGELARYLFYRYRYEMFPVQKIVDDFPPCLQIEPTSICNYRCVFCYQTDPNFHIPEAGHQGSMSMDLFKSLVDQAEGQCEAVTLASRGEPLLCPHLPEMLAYLDGKFLGLKLNTNASMLNERLAHALLQTRINTLVFSVDAASDVAYEQLRRGGKLKRVIENIKMFISIKNRDYPKSTLLTRVSGVKVLGASELPEMVGLWGDLVDQVAFVNQNPWHNTYERPENGIETPCSELWLRMFVLFDGRVNPCENDYQSTLSVGNAKEKRLSELWRSAAYTALRDHHLRRQRGLLSPCKGCPVV